MIRNEIIQINSNEIQKEIKTEIKVIREKEEEKDYNPLINYLKNNINNNPLMNLKNIKLIYNKKRNDLYLKIEKEMKKNEIIGKFNLKNIKDMDEFVIDKSYILKK